MKKICNGHFMSPFNTEDKTFRIMRLTFIALFVFSFSLLASVHSQTMRININANNVFITIEQPKLIRNIRV